MTRTGRLLCGVSAFAMTAGLSGMAFAYAPADDVASQKANSVTVEAAYSSDPLIGLMLRSQGHLTAQSVLDFLPDAVGTLSAERAEVLPDLMKNIRALGLGRDVEAAALRTLVGLVSDAAGKTLEKDMAAKLTIEITDQFAAEIQLAKVQNNNGTGKASDQGKLHNHNNGNGNGTYSN